MIRGDFNFGLSPRGWLRKPFVRFTLPETNSSFPLGFRPIFRCYVSFKGYIFFVSIETSWLYYLPFWELTCPIPIDTFESMMFLFPFPKVGCVLPRERYILYCLSGQIIATSPKNWRFIRGESPKISEEFRFRNHRNLSMKIP